MRKTILAAAVAFGLAFAFAAPILGVALSAASPIAARTAADDSLTITLMPPVQGRTFWYGGAVMPVIVLITENGTAVTNASATLWVNGTAAMGPGKAFTGNMFLNLGEGMYQYNLNTKPYPAGPGSAPIMVEVMAQAGAMSATLEFNMPLH